jgi:glycosyltransferase involved in cell wall biosynthesis
LRDQIAALGLTDRVELAGVVTEERLASLYAGADLFVLPSRYEGYGMAYTEAVSHGVPVVGTTAGAIPEAVPAGAGILVEPDDVAGLTATLRRLIESPGERAQLATGARAAAASLPSWTDAGRLFSQALDLVA